MSATVKAWVLLSGIFVVGIVTGSALTFGFASHFRGSHGEAEMRTHLMAMYVRKLDLTEDQRAKIRPIVQETAHNIQELHHDEVTKGFDIFRKANERILAILTPEQKTQLQQLEREQQTLFSSHLMHPNFPPGPGPNGPPNGGFHRFDQTGDMPPPPPVGQTNAPPMQAP